jgi:hypothetical protein
MDWSKFFEFYFQLWIISIPLTFYLFFSIIKWIIHLMDYLIHYDRIRAIGREISNLDLLNEKNKIIQNRNIIDKDSNNLKMLESLLTDLNKSALGSDNYNSIKKIIR